MEEDRSRSSNHSSETLHATDDDWDLPSTRTLVYVHTTTSVSSQTPTSVSSQTPTSVSSQTTTSVSLHKSTSLSSQKRSHHLTLVFISAAAAVSLAGCGRMENNGNVNRDVYKNLEECRADWGNSDDCEEIDEKRSASGSRGYYGPRYNSRTGNDSGGYSTTTRPGSRASGTVSSSPSRGGFGASSSHHGGSGHSASG